MKLDLANFIVEQMKPYIKRDAVEYEQKKFEDLLKSQAGSLTYAVTLEWFKYSTTMSRVGNDCCGCVEAGIDGLEYTKAWLKRNRQKLLDSSSSSTSMQQVAGAASASAADAPQAGQLPTPNAILATAFIELLDWDPDQILPEVC